MAVQTFETMLWDDRASVAPHLTKVLSILEDAGYTPWTKWEPTTAIDGPPGTYVCYALDTDPHSGLRNYDFRVFEDARRPVVDRVIETLRELDDRPNIEAPSKPPKVLRRKQRRAERKR